MNNQIVNYSRKILIKERKLFAYEILLYIMDGMKIFRHHSLLNRTESRMWQTIVD